MHTQLEEEQFLQEFKGTILNTRFTNKVGAGGKQQLSDFNTGRYINFNKALLQLFNENLANNTHTRNNQNKRIEHEIVVSFINRKLFERQLAISPSYHGSCEGNFAIEHDPAKWLCSASINAEFKAGINLIKTHHEICNAALLQSSVNGLKLFGLIDATASSKNGLDARLAAQLGILLVDANLGFRVPGLCLLGVRLDLNVVGGIGFGATGSIGIGITANKQGKRKVYGDLGAFLGPGAKLTLDLSLGLDTDLPARIHAARKENYKKFEPWLTHTQEEVEHILNESPTTLWGTMSNALRLGFAVQHRIDAIELINLISLTEVITPHLQPVVPESTLLTHIDLAARPFDSAWEKKLAGLHSLFRATPMISYSNINSIYQQQHAAQLNIGLISFETNSQNQFNDFVAPLNPYSYTSWQNRFNIANREIFAFPLLNATDRLIPLTSISSFTLAELINSSNSDLVLHNLHTAPIKTNGCGIDTLTRSYKLSDILWENSTQEVQQILRQQWQPTAYNQSSLGDMVPRAFKPTSLLFHFNVFDTDNPLSKRSNLSLSYDTDNGWGQDLERQGIEIYGSLFKFDSRKGVVLAPTIGFGVAFDLTPGLLIGGTTVGLGLAGLVGASYYAIRQ